MQYKLQIKNVTGIILFKNMYILFFCTQQHLHAKPPVSPFVCVLSTGVQCCNYYTAILQQKHSHSTKSRPLIRSVWGPITRALRTIDKLTVRTVYNRQYRSGKISSKKLLEARSRARSPPKSICSLALCHLSTEFLENRLSRFCTILLTNKRQWKHNLLSGGNHSANS